jgi:hypothetical protein
VIPDEIADPHVRDDQDRAGVAPICISAKLRIFVHSLYWTVGSLMWRFG